MDKLEKVFDMQKSLDDFIAQSRGLNNGVYTKSDWFQKKSIALIDEVTELLNEINYKWWKNPKPINDQAVKEELTDIFHFFISLCLEADMTAEELFNIYCNKNRENIARQQGKSEKTGYELQNNKNSAQI